MRTVREETITVPSHVLSAIYNDDYSSFSLDDDGGLYNEKALDMMSSFITDYLGSEIEYAHFTYGDTSEPYFGLPTQLPSTPSFDATEWNLRGNVVDITVTFFAQEN